MLDKNQHKTILVKILKEIYSNPVLRNVLGFKGGTAAFLFYNLPRLSVDLDFNLLKEEEKNVVFEKIKKLLSQFGKVTDFSEKRNTLFFLLSYQKGERNIKIEISKRKSQSEFFVKNYLGIPVLLIKKEDMAAEKLATFLTRKKFASRDLFDLWFFTKNDWLINKTVVKEKTGLSLKLALKESIDRIKKIKPNQLLQGLGELIEMKQKNWIKENLQKETIFYLNFLLKEAL